MSHKYYGFQKQEEDNFYTISFLSTRTQRLRFLNNEFVGYSDQNEFIIHKNPGLTIIRLSDNYLNNGLHNRSNTNKIMTEFLNRLLYSSNLSLVNQTSNFSSQLKIKQISIDSKASIRIKLNTY